ncbi:SEL1-like repeat protein [Moraxella oblonga]|uniref:SEL1-like repeat protein n=1 Tax=Moraxella oblonga TaxID=200413 RepID=UPI0014702684|nr:SEL1-like repeat protein [Moraxella oblonga]
MNKISHHQSLLEHIHSNPDNLTKLETLANEGNADVAYMLGWCYFKGEYLPKDLTKSMAWLEKAKTLGDDRAEELMVYCRFLQITEWSRDGRRN